MNFIKAKPIWVKGKNKELNECCLFFAKVNGGEYTLNITANSFYRVFVNGEFFAYGPARAAHGYARVDAYHLSLNGESNALFIEAAGYNCKSFYSLDTPAFLQAEVVCSSEAVAYTGRDFKGGEYTQRLKKVLRFSYQRPFTECYRFCSDLKKLYTDGDFAESQIEEVEGVELLERIAPYPVFKEEGFVPTEQGAFVSDDVKEVYRGRFMTTETLKIFKLDELEANPSDEASKLVYRKGSRTDGAALKAGEYRLYEFSRSLTGFIKTAVEAVCDSRFLVLFDELDCSEGQGEDNAKDIVFYRNETVNIIEYCVKKGAYEHISFEPYTAKYIKIVVLEGELKINGVGIVLYQNSLSDQLKFSCESDDVTAIIEAARNTFSQNAVDVLTDCPSRERAGWLCDSYFSSQAEKLFTGSNRVEYSFLQNYALLKTHPDLPEKTLPMCYPADFEDGVFIPNWTMWYMVELHEYFKRTGDRRLIDDSRDKVFNLIEFFKGYENSDGLLEDLPSWVFVEWSVANDGEYVKGVNYPSNMLYAYALGLASELYGESGLKEKAEKIKEAVRAGSYNGRFFEDNRVRENGELALKGHISETCQYYAFFTQTATEEDHPELFDTLLKSFGPKRDCNTVYPQVGKSNVFIGDYLRLDILRNKGLYEQMADESVEYFSAMARLTGTLWEYDSKIASLNHGFASYVANLLVEYLTGYVYTDCKNKLVYIKESKCALSCDISVPVPGGFVRLKRNGGELTVTLPEGYKIAKD